MRREKFGAKSEKLRPDQFHLPLEDVEIAQGVLDAAQEKAAALIKGKSDGAPRPSNRNRGQLPAHLPRVERIIEPKSTLCPCGCGEMSKIGEDVSERLDVIPIRVRMGLHTGTPTLTSEGYVGVDVHRGARVAALAHGGQVLVTEATATLVDGVALTDLGRHRLKDFDGPARLFQLGMDRHPPLRTPGTVLLPTPATRFLGRERELYDAVSLVLTEAPPILTIIGPGGTGKTRFSIELSRLLAEDAEGGTVFVPLAALRDPTLGSLGDRRRPR